MLAFGIPRLLGRNEFMFQIVCRTAAMATPEMPQASRTQSPDPGSHAANVYDGSGTEGEWQDETDDDDMDFEPTTDENEDPEFFDPIEDLEADFHGL